MIGTIIPAIQGALGLGQAIAGLVKKKVEIPKAVASEELGQTLTEAEARAGTGFSEASNQLFSERMGRAMASARAGIDERKGGLGAISKLFQSETDAIAERGIADEERRLQNLSQLYRAREIKAAEDARVDDINRQIALDERGRRDELIGAGLQNVMGAAGTYGTLGVLSGEDPLSDIFGGGGGRLNRTNRRSRAVGMSSPEVADALGEWNPTRENLRSLSDPYAGILGSTMPSGLKTSLYD